MKKILIQNKNKLFCYNASNGLLIRRVKSGKQTVVNAFQIWLTLKTKIGIPADIHLFKVHDGKDRTMCKIY